MNAPNWICRTQSHDFGVDLEAELIRLDGGTEELSGAIIKLQVKGTIKPRYKNGGFYIRIKADYLNYANQFKVPVLLLLVNISDQKIYYLWLQEYLIKKENSFCDLKSVLVRVPEENVLEHSFQRQLPNIALGFTSGSQLIAVQNLFEVFSLNYDKAALDLASNLLRHLDEDGHIPIFNNTIEKLIKRGPHLSRASSQVLGKILADLTRRFGDSLTTEQVLKMVLRGESYSLAGLDGLSGLYDECPEHTKKLNLASKFDDLELYELSWYCRFREANAELNSVDIWGAIFKIETAFQTRKGVLFIPDELREYCYSKWPNRSDMIYLQCLYPM